jgi:NDP-sugar pyrophosphorylase family protein
MRAILLAGGKGTRLYPYTTVLPKPLMPVGERPILEIIILQLKKYGYKDITIATGHLAELIEAYFGNGSKFGVRITYSREDKPLGTAGPLSLVNGLAGDFLVMNGDILTNLDFGDIMKFHKTAPKSVVTIATYKKDVKIDLGVLKINNDDIVTDYIEKPVMKYDVSTGIYVFNHRILKHIPKNQYTDFPHLIKNLIQLSEKIKVYRIKDKWLDIGNPADYELANKQIAELTKR